jgi:NSS family neurotransmitter:Na+ symporter
MFSIVEAVAGNYESEFSWSRFKAVTLATLSIFGMALLYSGGNGVYMIDALDAMYQGLMLSHRDWLKLYSLCTLPHK